MLHALNRTCARRAGALAAGLAGVLLLAACCRPALAQQTSASPDAAARDLATEVLRKAGNGDLTDWTRSVLDRALERAGTAARQTVPGSGSASPAPLPAERHALGIAASAGGRAGTAEVLVFMSSSVPAASWRQWARDAARLGAAEHASPPLVLRGVGGDGMRATVKRIGERVGGADAGVAIDPRLFRLFGIERVPAVVVVPGGVPPCRSRGCTDDDAPPHDLVTGNVGLVAALEAVAGEGDAGRAVAKASLERLTGDGR